MATPRCASAASSSPGDAGIPVLVGGPCPTPARDCTLRDDTCSGSTVPPDGSCSVTVAYRPTKGGPRLASLILPTPTDQLKIDLASAAPLGRTSLTTTGEEAIDEGGRTRFSPVVVYDNDNDNDNYSDSDGSGPDHSFRL